MPIPLEEQEKVARILAAYCERKIPHEVRDCLRLNFEFKGNDVILFEERPGFMDPERWVRSDVAKFRYLVSEHKWELYWLDRNLRWHVYEDKRPVKDFRILLKEVDEDPICIFWG